MMPNAPTAQCSNPPPVKRLYIPRKPLPMFFPPPASKKALSAPLSKPGQGTRQAKRQIPSTISVKTIRDFNSGILKQLLNVLRMALNILSKAYSDFFSVSDFLGFAAFEISGFSAGGFFFAVDFPPVGFSSTGGGPRTISLQAPPSFSIFALAEALKAWTL